MMNKRLPLELVGLFPPMREKCQRAQSGVKSFQSSSVQDFLSAQPVVLLKFFSHCWRDQYGFTGASLFLLLSCFKPCARFYAAES